MRTFITPLAKFHLIKPLFRARTLEHCSPEQWEDFLKLRLGEAKGSFIAWDRELGLSDGEGLILDAEKQKEIQVHAGNCTKDLGLADSTQHTLHRCIYTENNKIYLS